jgi:hypothetical protein
MTSFLVMWNVMVTVSLAQAKASLSELIDKVEGGEGVIITRHGKPVERFMERVPPANWQSVTGRR